MSCVCFLPGVIPCNSFFALTHQYQGAPIPRCPFSSASEQTKLVWYCRPCTRVSEWTSAGNAGLLQNGSAWWAPYRPFVGVSPVGAPHLPFLFLPACALHPWPPPGPPSCELRVCVLHGWGPPGAQGSLCVVALGPLPACHPPLPHHTR